MDLDISNLDPDALLVVVSVGTDHHPFERLVTWADEWAAAHPEAVTLIQYGTSHPPVTAKGEDYIGADAMDRLLARADVVVCHGGPSTIMAARELGRFPIVVPRKKALGEHVDDHQVAFSAHLAKVDEACTVHTREQFERALEAALVDRHAYELDLSRRPDRASGIGRFAELVNGFVWGTGR